MRLVKTGDHDIDVRIILFERIACLPRRARFIESLVILIDSQDHPDDQMKRHWSSLAAMLRFTRRLESLTINSVRRMGQNPPVIDFNALFTRCSAPLKSLTLPRCHPTNNDLGVIRKFQGLQELRMPDGTSKFYMGGAFAQLTVLTIRSNEIPPSLAITPVKSLHWDCKAVPILYHIWLSGRYDYSFRHGSNWSTYSLLSLHFGTFVSTSHLFV